MNVLKAFSPQIISFYMAYHFPLVFLLIFNSLLFSDFEYETVPALFLTSQPKFVVQSITSTYHIHECRRGGGKSLTCNIPKRWHSIDIPPLGTQFIFINFPVFLLPHSHCLALCPFIFLSDGMPLPIAEQITFSVGIQMTQQSTCKHPTGTSSVVSFRYQMRKSICSQI